MGLTPARTTNPRARSARNPPPNGPKPPSTPASQRSRSTAKWSPVTGEIIDLSCYLQLGKHGEKHKPCGVKCLQSGQPIGLLTKDGDIYMLMAEEHDPRRDGQTEGFRKAAIENFAKIVEVTGTETAHNGFRALYVQGYVAK